MHRPVMILGFAAIGLGLVVTLFPFVSIWRAGDQALAQLPEVTDREFTDQHHRIGALFNEDMVLVRRTYTETSVDQAAAWFQGAGFGSTRTNEHLWYTKECCGDWDAVWVRTEPSGPDVELVVTMFDEDIQSSWPLIVLVGLGLAGGGGLLVKRSSRRSSPGRRPESSTAQATTTA